MGSEPAIDRNTTAKHKADALHEPSDFRLSNDESTRLWDQIYSVLRQAVRRKLKGRSSSVGDSEDIAIMAFKSFVSYIQHNRRTDLIRPGSGDKDQHASTERRKLATKFAKNKAEEAIRKDNAVFRGGEFERMAMFEDALADTTDPIATETIRDFLEFLRMHRRSDPQVIQIVIMTLQSYNRAEIARELSVSESTIHRRTKLVDQIVEEFAQQYRD